MDSAEFRNCLIRIRTERDYSARRLSYELGKSATYIQEIESGKSMPSLATFFEICDVLDVTPSQFFYKEDDFKKTDLIRKISDMDARQIEVLQALADVIKKTY